MDYFFHIIVLVSIYTTLAVSLDLVAGHTGLLSLAHAAFYGIGAYATAILAVQHGVPFIGGIACGMSAAAALSAIVSLSSLRVHDDYFAVATFAFQMVVLSVLNNWMELTNGPLGVAGIPRPNVFGWIVQSTPEYAVLAACVAVAAYWVVGRIVSSPFGRVLRAIREDEILAQSLGKSTFRFKAVAIAISAALAAAAGGVYAHYITFIDPTSFTVLESILVLSMVILGGAASRWGPLVGAICLVLLPEVLYAIGLSPFVAAQLRQVLYGAALVAMMMLRYRRAVGRPAFQM